MKSIGVKDVSPTAAITIPKIAILPFAKIRLSVRHIKEEHGGIEC
jgi:hypothetical protein